MGQYFDSCPENLIEWIQKQHLFWVATAPLSPDGHVNLSPKGAFGCFHVLGPNKVWYEDLTGNGSETIAHLRENKRITILFTAFDGPPRIVRLFGTGIAYEFGTPEYEELIPEGTRMPGSRSAIVVDVHKVGAYCGYSIPCYEFKGDRTVLHEFASKLEANVDPEALEGRADKSMREFWSTENAKSIDGLPSVLDAPNATVVPSSTWRKEDEIARSKAKIAMSWNENNNVSSGDNGMPSANMGPKLVVAFTMGVFATLLCVRVAQLTVQASF